jgi:tetratricopeptide (TPR) repeat protein
MAIPIRVLTVMVLLVLAFGAFGQSNFTNEQFEEEAAKVLEPVTVTGDHLKRIDLAWTGRTLELDPDHYMSYYRYALQMKEDGDFEDAEQLMRHAIKLRPMNPRFRRELAVILDLQGREEEAQAEMEKAEAFQP